MIFILYLFALSVGIVWSASIIPPSFLLPSLFNTTGPNITPLNFTAPEDWPPLPYLLPYEGDYEGEPYLELQGALGLRPTVRSYIVQVINELHDEIEQGGQPTDPISGSGSYKDIHWFMEAMPGEKPIIRYDFCTILERVAKLVDAYGPATLSLAVGWELRPAGSGSRLKKEVALFFLDLLR